MWAVLIRNEQSKSTFEAYSILKVNIHLGLSAAEYIPAIVPAATGSGPQRSWWTIKPSASGSPWAINIGWVGRGSIWE